MEERNEEMEQEESLEIRRINACHVNNMMAKQHHGNWALPEAPGLSTQFTREKIVVLHCHSDLFESR